MLTAAVGLTLIGFVLLVIALMNANFALAVACIAVCVVGLLVLLYDTIRANRRGRAGVQDEPLFTIRGRESASRAEPLIDEDAAQADDQARTDDPGTGGFGASSVPTSGFPAGNVRTATGSVDDSQQEHAQAVVAPSDNTWEPAAGGGLGSVVSPDAHGNAVGDQRTSGPFTGQNPTGQTPPQTGSVGAGETGDANDYIRSVTGSFPAQTGQQPTVAPASYAPGAPAPETGTGEFGGSSAQPPAPTPTPAGSPTDTGSFGAVDSSSDPESAGYVGRRRRIEQSENVVVNTSDPTLPAMQFVYRDSDDEAAGESDSGAQSPSETDDR
ncbi:hypothetical protein [Gordonia sp. (in: high G+C Gram-positive bacteria)]|uniref:hypothetical protein n=1 Tax=Gordonia sp. (in: high G+C Gram-positive bacteria) TaxID=84139 RepID=UPI003F9E2C73